MRPSSLPIFLISLLLLLSTLNTKANAQQLINKTCETFSKQDPNIDYTFCKTSLQASPASRYATLEALGKISFRLIQNNITDTKSLIGKLKKNKNLDTYVRSCLDTCFELYSDAIDATKQATKDYEAKRYIDANVEITSVMDAASTCEEGFKEDNGVVSPLTKRNADSFELSAIAHSIINMIVRN